MKSTCRALFSAIYILWLSRITYRLFPGEAMWQLCIERVKSLE
jgi:hypothetical protein